ncbi:DUF4234 domain-containing protein [Candidatus Saccharibacteria bacterium]|nr:DUF4234 domain-containing protein [Candidatus Saccharibacteria bacterium]
MASKIKQRDPIVVLLLPIVTFGIYAWYWLVKTKGELNKSGADIPTAWWWLVPVVGCIYWLWKYSQGAAKVTKNHYPDVLYFLIFLNLSCIGYAIVQNVYNKLDAKS